MTPDRIQNLDFSDPEVIDSYLNHPSSQALVEDLGRAFRHAPAHEQRAELLKLLERTKARRFEFAGEMLKVVHRFDDMITSFKQRLEELEL